MIPYRSDPVAVTPAPPPTGLALPPVVVLPAGDKSSRWAALRELVRTDATCRVHLRPGKQAVLGVGNLDARIMFVGEAPGAEEEIQGEPFVGPAGQLLNRMITGMGLQRPEVYIGNIMNWRPDLPVAGGGAQIGNRPPTREEMAYCLPYLRAQIEIVRPEILVALGATAAQGLLGSGSFRALGEDARAVAGIRGQAPSRHLPSKLYSAQSHQAFQADDLGGFPQDHGAGGVAGFREAAGLFLGEMKKSVKRRVRSDRRPFPLRRRRLVLWACGRE